MPDRLRGGGTRGHRDVGLVEMATIQAAVVIVMALAFAAGFGLVLPWRPSWRRLILVALIAAILLLPLMVPSEYPVRRAAVAMVCVPMAMKLYDTHRAVQIVCLPSWPAYLVFLLHPFTLTQRKLEDEIQPAARQNQLYLLRGAAISVVGLTACLCIWRIDFAGVPFAIEHVVKVAAFMALVYGVVDVGTAVWRLPGWRARPHLHNFFLARTPADFWRRYSRVIGQFLYEDVYKQVRGRRAPARATLIVFAVSGLIHEYAFGIVTERVQGYQMAFFMVQGFAVAATQRIKPKGRQAVLWTVATVAFNLATSVLFFASLNQIWPFWSAGAPAFLLR